MIDESAYNGTLKPFLPDILALHARGASPWEIYAALRPRFIEHYRKHYHSSYGPPGGDNTIRYILRRVGALPQYGDSLVNDRRAVERREHAAKLRREGLSFDEIGQQLGGLSRERVRQILIQQERVEKRAAKRARSERITEEWLAEYHSREHARRTNKGRPLDMGGPRDQWLERSPWDDL